MQERPSGSSIPTDCEVYGFTYLFSYGIIQLFNYILLVFMQEA